MKYVLGMYKKKLIQFWIYKRCLGCIFGVRHYARWHNFCYVSRRMVARLSRILNIILNQHCVGQRLYSYFIHAALDVLLCSDCWQFMELWIASFIQWTWNLVYHIVNQLVPLVFMCHELFSWFWIVPVDIKWQQ